MFSGIVEERGEVERIESGKTSIQLSIRATLEPADLKIGDSLAVNGCCLTVVQIQGRGKAKTVRFDLLKETWERTNLQFVRPGSSVNLERSLRADGRLHGHFVTGHIDGVGKIKEFKPRGSDWFLEVVPPAPLLRYLVPKGAIAIDGISLTVADVGRRTFSVWIIPHTREVTSLRERRDGDAVNLEADMLAKYAEKLLRRR